MAQTSLRRGTQEDGNTEYFTGCPIGGGFIWYGLPDKIPSNCRICDNSTLAISSFAKLYENLDGAWGESGANMNLPDLRGRFPRGVDGGAMNDPDSAGRTGPNTGQNTGDAIGSIQADAFQNITGSLDASTSWGMPDSTVTKSGALRTTTISQANSLTAGTTSTRVRALTLDASLSPGARTSTETRPSNVNVYFVIRVE